MTPHCELICILLSVPLIKDNVKITQYKKKNPKQTYSPIGLSNSANSSQSGCELAQSYSFRLVEETLDLWGDPGPSLQPFTVQSMI